MKKRFSWIFMFMCASFGAFGQAGLSIDGLVLDEQTHKPIPGVFVIAQWRYYGSDAYGSRTSCPHLEVVRTDDEGRYHIPAWLPGLVSHVQRAVFAYKGGYEEIVKSATPNVLTAAEVALNEKQKVMGLYTGTGDERVVSYTTFGSLEGCGSAEDYTKKLIPLYRAIYEEAKTLKVTDRNKEKLKGDLGFFGEFGDESKNWWKPNYGKPSSKESLK
jgi:hypothetical protein